MTTMTFPIRRVLRLAALVPMLALAAACGDDDATEPEPEPTFTRMALTFTPTGGGQAQTVEITRASASASGPLTIPATGGTIAAVFLNADGTADQVINGNQGEYETRIALVTGSQVTFTRTGPNTFTVSRSSAGTTTALVQLWHLATNHDDLEANVTLNVQ